MPLPLAKITPADDIAPQYDIFERLDAAIELGRKDTFVVNRLRNNLLDSYEEMKAPEGFGMIQPEEANKLFTNVEVPFTKPVPYFFAQELDEEARENKKLMNIMSNRGRDSVTGVSLAGGLIGHALDPVETGSDILIGLSTAGVGSLLSKINKTKNSAKIAFMAQKLQSKTFTKSLVEGVVANVALETENYYSSKRAQRDYGVSDAFISVVGGSIVMPAALHGLPKGGRFLKNKFEAQGLYFKTAVKDFLDGKIPKDGGLRKYYTKLFEEPSNAPVGSIRASHTYKALNDINMPERDFYMAARNTDNIIDVNTIEHHTFDSDFGDNVIHLTDDPNKAHNFAGDRLSEQVGSVHNFKINPKKMINGDDITDSRIGKIIKNYFDEELQEVYSSGKTIKEGLDNVRHYLDENNLDIEPLNALNSSLKNKGFDGYRYTMYNELGDAVSHGAAIFKGMDNTNYVGTAKVIRDQVPDLSEKEAMDHIASVQSKDNDIGYSKSIEEELESVKPVKEMTQDEIDSQDLKTLKDIEENIKSMNKDYLSDADKKFIKVLEDAAGDEALEQKATSDYIACLLKVK